MAGEYRRGDLLRGVCKALAEGMPGWHVYLEELGQMRFPALQITMAALSETHRLAGRRHDAVVVQIVAITEDYSNKDYYDVAQRVQGLLERFEYAGIVYGLQGFDERIEGRTLYMSARTGMLYRRAEQSVPTMERMRGEILHGADASEGD